MSQVLAQFIAGFAGVAATVAAKYVEIWLTRRFRANEQKALEDDQ